eukprot:TRINITY_DN3328_c0_g1_i2.p1 TRINITY_DN3328_c0_g1~~TRINITY_DN3328_c0_g1_i2.p1  ORF type:complete len:441 (-),score=71.15 TRINITY_DN3328_c0_g1_i2:181-1503(-)
MTTWSTRPTASDRLCRSKNKTSPGSNWNKKNFPVLTIELQSKMLALRRKVVSEAFKVTAALNTFQRGFADDSNLLKTPLYDFHLQHGGKMVPFAGWSMPVQYAQGVMESTINCRKNAALFDVSHMCGITFKGKDALTFLESLVVGDIKSLQDGTGTLSVFTNENGGIIDDTVITKVDDNEAYLVVNAGCRDKDIAHIKKYLEKFSGDCELIVHDDRGLLAVQGPAAAEVIQPMVEEDLSKVYFSNFKKLNIKGVPCYLTRTGYTGEDGFELSIPNASLVELANALVAHERLQVAGLGARDALRLEAGLCLYGNDMDENITPIEAGLTWTIAKSRREKCDFLGGEKIKQQLNEGVSKRRVGFVSSGAPARQHCDVLLGDGTKVGEITSGVYSPNLKKNIAMGYVEKAHAKAGTELKIQVRSKVNDATVTKMPFVPTNYFKG